MDNRTVEILYVSLIDSRFRQNNSLLSLVGIVRLKPDKALLFKLQQNFYNHPISPIKKVIYYF